MNLSRPYRAVALFSGGLDSMLSALLILRQGIRVSAIAFSTPFEARTAGRMLRETLHRSFLETRGIDLVVRHLGDEMLDIVRSPKHGYGKNVNPCIDCRILMLREAKRYMDSIGAHFLVTGEVLGQRPMSQRRDMLYHIDKEAGVTDLVVRPLSGQLLRSTIPEQKGIIDRQHLYAFSGRSRKPQIALAREYGVHDYPPPAGGCLLTEPNYAFRLRDLLNHTPSPSLGDIDLLKIGRHFRYSPRCKIIVGRDQSENAILEAAAKKSDYLLRVEGYGSPITLVTGDVTDETVRCAAGICARYSDVPSVSGEVRVRIFHGGRSSTLTVHPAPAEILEPVRIGKGLKYREAKV